MALRVLFLTLYPEGAASPRYRVLQFLPHLREHGILCDVAAPLSENRWSQLTGSNRPDWGGWYHLHETPRRLLQLLRARKYDVVVLQKAVMTAYWWGLHTLVRGMARRLVYDIDDAVHLSPPHPLHAPWSLLEDRTQVLRLFRDADLVLAGNRWLTEEARSAGANAVEFPTVVDTDRFLPGAAVPPRYRVGWMGSPSTTPALGVLVPALNTLADADIRLVGADAKQVDCARAEVQPWSYATEVRELQEFSVGLFPQQRDPWTLGKCALKAITYMACGVPPVATPYGAALDIIHDGATGLFADNTTEWSTALERLRDPGLRAQLGAAARADVENRFSLREAAPRLRTHLEGLM
jgi:glycosyltransferase involved in cell wall biosynthesis